MSNHRLTGSDLWEAVFEIVSREMGPAVLVRYIAENFSQPGSDYTEARALRPQPTIEDISATVTRLKSQQGGTLAPPGARRISGDEE